MEKEEIVQEIKTVMADEVKKYSDLAASKDELQKLTDGLEAVKSDINTIAEKQANATIEPQKTLIESIKSNLVANKEVLETLKNEKTQFNFEVKTVGTMTFAASVDGEIPQAMRLPGVNNIPQRFPFIMELITMSTATSNPISWVEEVVGEGDANYTAEGDKKNQKDFNLQVASEKIHKITVFIKVSEEMLNDVDFMASEINNSLLRSLTLKIDTELLKGAGGANAINGILTQSTAFSAGSHAGAVTGANRFDALQVAIDQVYINHGVPNFIVLHPSDVTTMSLSKDKNNQYLFPSFTLPGGKTVSGIPVVTNTGMTIDNFLVMDGTKATVYVKEGVKIEVGYENDDFTRNLRTILAEARMCLIIKGNDKKSFVKGTFTSAIADLTPSES